LHANAQAKRGGVIPAQIVGETEQARSRAYNNQTISLNSKLGFRTREPLSLMGGPAPKVRLPGYEVRSALQSDIDRCNELCHAVHGHTRAGEVADGVRDKTATVVEHLGRVAGYATNVGFFFHAVSETNDGMTALIGAAKEIAGPGILVPTRNHDLFTWCLSHNMKLVQQMTLMTIGLYCERWAPTCRPFFIKRSVALGTSAT
jgi:hypothetical protein